MPAVDVGHHKGALVQDTLVDGSGGRILLVVDDDKDLREAVVDILEIECSHVCHVVAASGPQEAKEIVVREPGARLWKVLSDIDMPGGSGLDLCVWIHERFAHVDLAIMTGRPSEERAEIARRIPARFFRKPVNLGDLLYWTRH